MKLEKVKSTQERAIEIEQQWGTAAAQLFIEAEKDADRWPKYDAFIRACKLGLVKRLGRFNEA